MLFLKTRQTQRARTPRPARPALPLALSLKTSLRPSCCPCRLFLARCWPAFFLISRFSVPSITASLPVRLGRRSATGGMCRPSVFAIWPKAGRCCLSVLAAGLHCLHWCQFLAVLVVPPCAACRASTKSHGRRPSIYREGEPTEGWGNPEGVPRPQAASGVSFCAGGRVIHRPKSFKDLNMF